MLLLAFAAALLAAMPAALAWTGQDATPVYSGADTPSGGPPNLYSTIAATSGWTCSIVNFDDSISGNVAPATFSFPYYGTAYSTVYMGSNGYVMFTSPSTWLSGGGIPTTWDLNGAVMGIFEDLDPGNGQPGQDTCVKTTGSGTSEIFHAKWTNTDHWPSGNQVNFLIMLQETTGAIEVHYGNSLSDSSGAEYAGIENTLGTLGVAYNTDASAPSNIAVQYRPVTTAPTATPDSYTLNCNYIIPCVPLVVDGAAGVPLHKLLLAGPAGSPAADTGILNVPIKATRLTAPAAGSIETVVAGACSGTVWATGWAAANDGAFCFRPPAVTDPCGTYNFTYRADDPLADDVGATVSDVANVTITLVNCALPPVAVDDPCPVCAGGLSEYEAMYGQLLTVTAGDGLLVNDYDPGNVPPSNVGLTIDCVGLCALPAGSGTLSVNPNGSFTYMPPMTGTCQILSFQYRVRNALNVPSPPADVLINVCPNLAPEVLTMDVAPNPCVLGDVVTYEATASDADGHAIVFEWDFGDGVAAVGATPTHVYTRAGIYEVRVEAVDPFNGRGSATTTIQVNYPPNPDAGDPLHGAILAFAGPDASVAPGSFVTLAGSAPGWAEATFTWRQLDGPVIELLDDETATPSFVVLGEKGEAIVLELVAHVGDRMSAPDTVELRIASANHAPVPVAQHLDALPGQRVILDASASYDLDDDGLVATWTQVQGSAMELVPAGDMRMEGTAPREPGILQFLLTVDDGEAQVNRTVVVRVASGLGYGEPFLSSIEGGRMRVASRIGGEGYTWAFGDGTSGTGPEAYHDYAAPGEYAVTLYVLGDDGRLQAFTRLIEVDAAYLAAEVPPVAEAPGQGFLSVMVGIACALAVARRNR